MVRTTRAWLGTRAAAVPFVPLAALVAFAPVVTYGFSYDDVWTIERNDALGRPLGWLVRRLAAGHGAAFHIPDATRPMLVITTWFDRHLWGTWAGGYHLVSLALYAVVVVLAYFAALTLSRSRRIALVAGLVFALAPVHTEVVAAINYREDLLAAIGVLGPLVWLLWPKSRIDRPMDQLWLSLLWGVGLFGKENAAVLPLLLCAACVIRNNARSLWSRNEAALFALGGMFLVWVNYRAAFLLGGDDVPRAPRGDFGDVLLATARFETRAVVDSLIPVFASVEYPREGTASWLWALPAVAIAIVVVELARHVRTRTPALGLAFAALAALPSSPLVGPANARADRYVFLSVLGGALVWGWVGQHAARMLPRRRRAELLAAACTALALTCYRAERPWHDDFSLWSAAVTQAPSSPRAWTGLSRVLRLRGDVEEARRAVDRALYLDDAFVPARVTRTYTLIALGDTDSANQELDRLRRDGNGDYRGVANAIRCLRLPKDRARECVLEH